jgi:hypothetical protein
MNKLRMASHLLVVCALPILAALPLNAQEPDPQCTGLAQGADACQKAVDIFKYMNPQVGMLISGGNATLGQGGTLGGLGRFAITLRANVTQQLSVPDLDEHEMSDGPVRRTSYATTDNIGGFPAADVAIGLYKGYSLGITRVGGIDALVNVFYLPGQVTSLLEESETGVTLPQGSLKLGYGVRVGLIGETTLLPGVSLTYLRRDLPPLGMTYTSESSDGFTSTSFSDTISLKDFSVKTSAWRLVAGKKLSILAVAVGVGKDRYETSGDLSYVVRNEAPPRRTSGNLRFSQVVTPTNMFADLSLDLFLFRLVGEVGRVSGSDIATYNQFSRPANEPRVYGAVGLLFGR